MANFHDKTKVANVVFWKSSSLVYASAGTVSVRIAAAATYVVYFPYDN